MLSTAVQLLALLSSGSRRLFFLANINVLTNMPAMAPVKKWGLGWASALFVFSSETASMQKTAELAVPGRVVLIGVGVLGNNSRLLLFPWF